MTHMSPTTTIAAAIQPNSTLRFRNSFTLPFKGRTITERCVQKKTVKAKVPTERQFSVTQAKPLEMLALHCFGLTADMINVAGMFA